MLLSLLFYIHLGEFREMRCYVLHARKPRVWGVYDKRLGRMRKQGECERERDIDSEIER